MSIHLKSWTLTPKLVIECGNFLNYKDLHNSTLVSTVWNRALKNLLPQTEDEHCNRIGYPSQLIEAFRRSGLSLCRQPELELNSLTSSFRAVSAEKAMSRNGTWSTDALYRIVLNPNGVTSPVMKFTHRKDNDPNLPKWEREMSAWQKKYDVGIAFRVRPKDPESRTAPFVIGFFMKAQTDTDFYSQWTTTYHSKDLEHLHQIISNSNQQRPDPMKGVIDLIKGKNPKIEIDWEPEPLEQPAAAASSAPVALKEELVAENSCWNLLFLGSN